MVRMSGYIMPAQFIYMSIDWQPGLPNRYLRLQVLFFFFFLIILFMISELFVSKEQLVTNGKATRSWLLYLFLLQFVFSYQVVKAIILSLFRIKITHTHFKWIFIFGLLKMASIRQRQLLKEKLAFIKKNPTLSHIDVTLIYLTQNICIDCYAFLFLIPINR